MGIRLNPFAKLLDCFDETAYGTFCYLVEQLNKRGLAYLRECPACGDRSRHSKKSSSPVARAGTAFWAITVSTGCVVVCMQIWWRGASRVRGFGV